MSDDDAYTPIACGLYSEYEVAVLQRRPLLLQWRDELGQLQTERLIPRDLQTRNQCEYLIGENREGVTLAVRLDRILHTEPE
jgi:Rho-binding antiterminator